MYRHAHTKIPQTERNYWNMGILYTHVYIYILVNLTGPIEYASTNWWFYKNELLITRCSIKYECVVCHSNGGNSIEFQLLFYISSGERDWMWIGRWFNAFWERQFQCRIVIDCYRSFRCCLASVMKNHKCDNCELIKRNFVLIFFEHISKRLIFCGLSYLKWFSTLVTKEKLFDSIEMFMFFFFSVYLFQFPFTNRECQR